MINFNCSTSLSFKLTLVFSHFQCGMVQCSPRRGTRWNCKWSRIDEGILTCCLRTTSSAKLRRAKTQSQSSIVEPPTKQQPGVVPEGTKVVWRDWPPGAIISWSLDSNHTTIALELKREEARDRWYDWHIQAIFNTPLSILQTWWNWSENIAVIFKSFNKTLKF